jgi:hypothetical protein
MLFFDWGPETSWSSTSCGDHGTRKGQPAERPEPGSENNEESGSDLEAEQEVLEEIRQCTGVDIAPILRSAPESRPPGPMVIPRSEEGTQTEHVPKRRRRKGNGHRHRRETPLPEAIT